MLPSEMAGPDSGDGSWHMGQIPGPGRKVETHSFAGAEVERLRRELAERDAELEAYRGPREPSEQDGEAPLYRLLTQHYLGSSMADWRIYDAGSVVEFHDVPNLNMVPLNDAAKRRMEAEVEHQRSCQAEVFAASGAGHGGGLISDLHQLLDHARQDARRVANEAGRHSVGMPVDNLANPPPLQAHLSKAKRGRPRKVVRDVTPAQDEAA